MIATIFHAGKEYRVDLYKPIDISMPLSTNENSTRAWYQNPITMEPVRMGDWIGDINEGGSVNFRTITFNPHAHGTHTECVGHISKEFYTVNAGLKQFFFIAELVTILPLALENGDFVITAKQLEAAMDKEFKTEAIIIRTLGNGPGKLHTNYSNTNPPYLLKEAVEFLNSRGIQHLLIDMPSIDRESDGGKLEAHHTFWNYPHHTDLTKTITEMIYVPNEINDGVYLLNIQIAPFENDASPSKPILYKVY
ncbi:MAG: cyclase family protein [Bacteroidia bacterium]|jgi:kynurenine formamidase|nr:cyclase family protein [Bacteroidia bacterium]